MIVAIEIFSNNLCKNYDFCHVAVTKKFMKSCTVLVRNSTACIARCTAFMVLFVCFIKYFDIINNNF
jgi:hypothetical protein